MYHATFHHVLTYKLFVLRFRNCVTICNYFIESRMLFDDRLSTNKGKQSVNTITTCSFKALIHKKSTFHCNWNVRTISSVLDLTFTNLTFLSSYWNTINNFNRKSQNSPIFFFLFSKLQQFFTNRKFHLTQSSTHSCVTRGAKDSRSFITSSC